MESGVRRQSQSDFQQGKSDLPVQEIRCWRQRKSGRTQRYQLDDPATAPHQPDKALAEVTSVSEVHSVQPCINCIKIYEEIQLQIIVS